MRRGLTNQMVVHAGTGCRRIPLPRVSTCAMRSFGAFGEEGESSTRTSSSRSTNHSPSVPGLSRSVGPRRDVTSGAHRLDGGTPDVRRGDGSLILDFGLISTRCRRGALLHPNTTKGPASRRGPSTSHCLRASRVEVSRQCSNLAPSLQSAVSAHRAIRRRHRTAAVSQGSTRPLPKPVPRLTAEMLEEAERRYRGGEILRVIAGDVGVSRQRLAERLRERGVRLRREKPSSEQVLEMCHRYEQGESLARIGERLGFNPSSVRMCLLRAGKALRDPQGRAR